MLCPCPQIGKVDSSRRLQEQAEASMPGIKVHLPVASNSITVLRAAEG